MLFFLSHSSLAYSTRRHFKGRGVIAVKRRICSPSGLHSFLFSLVPLQEQSLLCSGSVLLCGRSCLHPPASSLSFTPSRSPGDYPCALSRGQLRLRSLATSSRPPPPPHPPDSLVRYSVSFTDDACLNGSRHCYPYSSSTHETRGFLVFTGGAHSRAEQASVLPPLFVVLFLWKSRRTTVAWNRARLPLLIASFVILKYPVD